MIRIYLAARYSRREELCGYCATLNRSGFVVTSRWLNGNHQISDTGTPIGDAGEALIEGDDGSASPAAARLREQFALEDIRDVHAADCMIAFTEPPRSSASRGGRHVELGLAIAMSKRIIIVGPRENIFCWLPNVLQFDNFNACLQFLLPSTTP